MFKIEFFCDDKRLGLALRALVGLAIEPPKVVPVTNAIVQGGKLRAKTNGSTDAMFRAYLAKLKKTSIIMPQDIRDFCTAHGMSSKSYSNVLSNAVKAKLLRRVKVVGSRRGRNKFAYRVMQ